MKLELWKIYKMRGGGKCILLEQRVYSKEFWGLLLPNPSGWITWAPSGQFLEHGNNPLDIVAEFKKPTHKAKAGSRVK